MKTKSIIKALTPFGSVTVDNQADQVVFVVTGKYWKIEVTYDECSQPRFKGFEHGHLIMDTRDDLDACLAVFDYL